MLKLEEARKLGKEELHAELAETTKKLFKLGFEVTTGASKAANDLKNLRRYRAQLMTVSKEARSSEEKKFNSQKKV
jgi:ribosomal protein L29